MKAAGILIIGAGSRGTTYASLARPNEARVVGVAEPRDAWRERMAEAHAVPPANVTRDWRELASRVKLADAVVIATPDRLHVEPAIAFARKGYHVLLEKPMAPDEESCRRIVSAALDAGVVFAVCHVLRYTPYSRRIKELVEGGAIGDVVSVQQLEPVGYWHQAHSYVRGSWSREEPASSMLLAKCCHDLDWIRFILGSRCVAIQSFGTLKHFRVDNRPPGAAPRCVECSVEPSCPYSAVKIYLGRVASGCTGWPVDVLVPEVTEASVLEALHTGPYGRCVYGCDNDVVDHQIVNMLFDGGQTASLTMTGFTEADHRQTRIFGTRGQLVGDGRTIRRFDFLTDRWEVIETGTADPSILGGHGGGDAGLMEAFVDAVRHGDQHRVLSGPEESLESHLMAFAAERSRTENRVVSMAEMSPQELR
jgi:predicted dehydrogenase